MIVFKDRLKKLAIPFFILSVCSIGVFVRVQVIHHDLWLDELATAWVVNDNFSKIFERCWINNLSPLYYIFVYISKLLFGFSESSLRIPSTIAGVLTIPAIYLLTYRLSRNHMLAVFASFLSSLDYSLIQYSYEVRPYSLLQFFTLIQLYFFLGLLYDEPKVFNGVFLGILSGIIILLHYTAGIIFILETFIATVYFLRTRNFSRAKITALLTCILLLVIFSIPVLKHIIYLYEYKDILGSFIKMKSINSSITIHSHLIEYILLPIVFTIFVGYITRNSKNENRLPNDKTFELFFLFSWYFIPILLQWALSRAGIVNVYHPRYLLWILPAPIIASAILISVFRTKRAKIVFIITLLLITQFRGSKSLEHLIKGDFRNTIGARIAPARFDWKEAVNKINYSGIVPSKVYIQPGLVERKRLKNPEDESRLLNEYLISPVNSMYKLDKIYLDRAVPIASIVDIPDLTPDFLLVGTLKTEEVEKYFECSIEMSPEDAKVKIFYVKGKPNCQDRKMGQI